MLTSALRTSSTPCTQFLSLLPFLPALHRLAEVAPLVPATSSVKMTFTAPIRARDGGEVDFAGPRAARAPLAGLLLWASSLLVSVPLSAHVSTIYGCFSTW